MRMRRMWWLGGSGGGLSSVAIKIKGGGKGGGRGRGKGGVKEIRKKMAIFIEEANHY